MACWAESIDVDRLAVGHAAKLDRSHRRDQDHGVDHHRTGRCISLLAVPGLSDGFSLKLAKDLGESTLLELGQCVQPWKGLNSFHWACLAWVSAYAEGRELASFRSGPNPGAWRLPIATFTGNGPLQ